MNCLIKRSGYNILLNSKQNYNIFIFVKYLEKNLLRERKIARLVKLYRKRLQNFLTHSRKFSKFEGDRG